MCRKKERYKLLVVSEKSSTFAPEFDDNRLVFISIRTAIPSGICTKFVLPLRIYT